MIEDTRCVDRATMREVTALVEVESHECVARIEAAEQYSLVSLCTRVRLNIGILGIEEFLHSFNGKSLYLVDNLTTTIVALARVTLGILVCEV